MMDLTFRILATAHGTAFECALCRRVSYNPGDISNHYCGNCHIWHDLLAEVRNALRDGATHECAEWRTAIGYCAVCERPVTREGRW